MMKSSFQWIIAMEKFNLFFKNLKPHSQINPPKLLKHFISLFFSISFINFIAHVIVIGNETRRLKMCDISTSFDSFFRTYLQLRKFAVKGRNNLIKWTLFSFFYASRSKKTSLFVLYYTKRERIKALRASSDAV